MQDCQTFLNSSLKSSLKAKTTPVHQPSVLSTQVKSPSFQFNSVPGIATLFSCLSLGLLTQQSAMARGNILDESPNLPAIASLPSTNSQNSQTTKLPSSKSLNATSFATQIGKDKRHIPQLPSLTIARVTSQKSPAKTYQVRSGDTLESIARQHGVSTRELVELNQLSNPNFILVNSQLNIPDRRLSQNLNSRNINSPKIELLTQNFSQSASVSSTSPSISFASLTEKKAQSRKQKRLNRLNRDEAASNNLSEEKNQSVTFANDQYISKLRQDIVKLRTKYQEQNGNPAVTSRPVITTPTTPATSTMSSVATSNFRRRIKPNSNITETTPLKDISSTSNLVSFLPDNAIAPSLPPLAAPEEYFPSNQVFNGYLWPAKGTLTSGYGWRWGRMHKGIDIAAPIGTPIIAAASGEVIFSGWSRGGYGNLVKLKHSDGSVTLYAHNHRNLVRKGQEVKQGQLIAEMGSTGRSTGPHLHFEIRPNGREAINPIARLPKNR